MFVSCDFYESIRLGLPNKTQKTFSRLRISTLDKRELTQFHVNGCY